MICKKKLRNINIEPVGYALTAKNILTNIILYALCISLM